MDVSEIYRQKLKRGAPEAVLSLIAKKAVLADDWESYQAFLGGEHGDYLLKAAELYGSPDVWLSIFNGVEDSPYLAKFFRTGPMDAIVRLVEEESVNSETLLIAWERADNKQKFQILKNWEWRQEPPYEVASWLMREKPFKELGLDEKTAYQEISWSAETAGWAAAKASKRADLLVSVSVPFTSEKETRHLTGALLKARADGEELDVENLTKAVLEYMNEILGGARNHSAYLLDLLGALEPFIAADSPLTAEIRKQRPAPQVSTPLTRTERKQLRSKIISDEVLGKAYAQSISGDDLLLVFKSDLSAEQGLDLIEGFGSWNAARLQALLEGRSVSWLEQTLPALLETSFGRYQLPADIGAHLSEQEKSRLALSIISRLGVTSTSGGKGIRVLGRLQEWGMLTRGFIEESPVGLWDNLNEGFALKLLGYLEDELGDSVEHWEAFDKLAPSFTGNVGQLTEVIKNL